MKAAFDRVCDPRNWKNPINAIIQNISLDLVHDAVIHFTGSVPVVDDLGNGWSQIRAKGYYLTIGA